MTSHSLVFNCNLRHLKYLQSYPDISKLHYICQSDLAGSNALEIVCSKVPEIINLGGGLKIQQSEESTDGADRQSLYPRKAQDLQH